MFANAITASKLRESLSPRRMENPMDFNAIIEPAIKFFSTGIGAMIADFARAIYNALYPANAGAATTQTSAVTPPPGK